MRNYSRSLERCKLFACLLVLALVSLGSGQVSATGVDLGTTRMALLAELKASGVKLVSDPQKGTVRFVGATRSTPVMVAGVAPGAASTINAMVIIEKYAPLFGLKSPREELIVQGEGNNATGGGRVRYQQMFKGIPVIGGELIVNMDRGGALLSMNGETAAVPKNLSLTPKVDKIKASTTALGAVAKWHKLSPLALISTEPELTIYDESLIGPGSGFNPRLVWRLEVRSRSLAPIRELVLIDAQLGVVALHFNQVDNFKNRRTYSANNADILPGTQKCDESAGDACTKGADREADFAHHYIGDTYDFYKDNHNRDGYDNAGSPLISSVDFKNLTPEDTPCPNAWFDSSLNQMVYCQGLSEADDVVAHEYTHAITDRTSKLFYYYQSGAINESFSDLWGEFVDQTNGSGNDTPAVKWLIGEDLRPYSGMGIVRDMKNPPSYHDPDRMTSALYYLSSEDSGGVHINSGVNNKAVYLMTDGDSFNGQTISGLGITKVAKIYYEVQTNLLTSGSNYQDLGNALYQACTNLLGTSGITATDCDQVLAATTAVEMEKEPPAGFTPQAQVCAAGQVVKDAFFDNMEAGLDKWSITAGTGTQQWFLYSGYATSKDNMLFGPDVSGISDQRATITVKVPSGQPYLHFRHAYEFEQSNSVSWDGGVLEYSTNGGTTWTDAMGMFNSGRNYSGTIYSGSDADNPLRGRSAFADVSHGYVSTRLNLAQLAGQTVMFRWRLGTDSSGDSMGWLLDDVRVYTCKTNLPPTANAGAAKSVTKGAGVTLNGQGSSDPDGSIVSYLWTQAAGAAVVLQNATTATPSFTAPTSSGVLTFLLQVTDNNGSSASATTTVTVNNTAPTAEAGPGQTVNPGSAVTLSGTASFDSDGSIATYSWTQTGGTTVTLNNSNAALASFTAPVAATTLKFSLKVTDNEGATATDTTTVTVSPPVQPADGGGGGGGGGGCSLSQDGGADPLLSLVFVMAVAMIRRKSKNRA